MGNFGVLSFTTSSQRDRASRTTAGPARSGDLLADGAGAAGGLGFDLALVPAGGQFAPTTGAGGDPAAVEQVEAGEAGGRPGDEVQGRQGSA